MAVYRIKRFSSPDHMTLFAYDSPAIGNGSKLGYPKFVLEFIAKVQCFLRTGKELCYTSFPIVPLDPALNNKWPDPDKNGYIAFFKRSVEECDKDCSLVWKDGKWYEKSKGILGATYKELHILPGQFLVSLIEKEYLLYDDISEYSDVSDYKMWRKAFEELKKLRSK